MRNAPSLLLTLLVAGCDGDGRDKPVAGNEVTASNEILANADIEALPADESATTSANELANGVDDPDVRNLGNQH